MKTIYSSRRPDSDFAIVEIDGQIYAIDEDKVEGGWGRYLVDRECIFWVAGNEFISVSPLGEIKGVDAAMDDCIFFGDFDFDDDAESEDLS